MKKVRPKTGEPRKTHQPLKIDLLPQAAKDAIEILYDRGLTWQQMEEQSAKPFSREWQKDGGGFIEWESLDLKVLEQFPDMKLPKSSLHRWFDIRISQARKQVLEQAAKTREFVAAFAGKDVAGANSAVVNALRDMVFGLVETAGTGDKAKFMDGLKDLTLAMTRMQRVELQAKRVEADLARLDAERAKLAAEAGEPREIYLLAAQDLLKKLRSRKKVREVLDPIQDELVQELSHAAEAFAKQVEASAA